MKASEFGRVETPAQVRRKNNAWINHVILALLGIFIFGAVTRDMGSSGPKVIQSTPSYEYAD